MNNLQQENSTNQEEDIVETGFRVAVWTYSSAIIHVMYSVQPQL
jgi:hypothetical protein